MFRFMKMGFRNLRRNRWQALLSIIGITLAVAFAVGITTIVTAVNQDFVLERRGNSRVDMTIQGVDDQWISFNGVETRLASLRNDIERLSPVIIVSFNLTELGGEGFITIYGLDPASHPDWDEFSVVSGVKSLERRELIISSRVADNLSVSAGDSVSVLGFSFTVSGIFDDRSQVEFARQPSSNLILMDVDVLRQYMGQTGDQVTAVVVTVSNFFDVELTYRKILNAVGDRYVVMLERTVNSFDRLVINAYGATMTAVILITLFVEFIFLSNLYLIIVNEQQPNIGLMRALGMSRWQVAMLFVLEITIYGMIGSALGLYIGHFFASTLMKTLLESQGLSIENLPSLSLFDVLFAFESGLFITLVAGLYPTAVILRYSIAHALQERRHLLTQGDKDIPIKRMFFIFGSIFLVLGIALTIQAAQEKALEIRLDSAFALSILLVFLGVFLMQLLSMWFLPSIIQAVGSLFSKFLIPISTRNIARYRIRSIASVATNAMALTFALTVIIITSALAYHVPSWYQEAFPSTDLIVEIKEDQPLFELNVTSFQNETSQIKDLTYIKLAYGRSSGTVEEIVDVFAIQSSKFPKFAPRSLQGRNLSSLGVLDTPSILRVIVTTSFAQVHSLSVNDTFRMTLIFTGRVLPFVTARIQGIVSDNVFSLSSNSLQVFADEDILEQVFNVTLGVKYVLIDLVNPTPEEIQSVSEALTANHSAIRSIYSTRDRLERLNIAIRRQETFLRALTYQSILIAALTQFVAILLSAERSRYEIGIIRANGLDQKRVLMLFIMEGMILGVVGLVMGWIDSFIASQLLKSYIERMAGQMVLIIPLDELLLWSVIFLVVIFLATLYPGWRTATLPVVRSLDIRSQLFGTTISFRELIKKLLDNWFISEYRRRIFSPTIKKLIPIFVLYLVLGYFFIRTLQLLLSASFFAFLLYLFLKDDLKKLELKVTQEGYFSTHDEGRLLSSPSKSLETNSSLDTSQVATGTETFKEAASNSNSVPVTMQADSQPILSSRDLVSDDDRQPGTLVQFTFHFSRIVPIDGISFLALGLVIFISFRMVDLFARRIVLLVFQSLALYPNKFHVSLGWLFVLGIFIFVIVAILLSFVEYPIFRIVSAFLSRSSIPIFGNEPVKYVYNVLEQDTYFKNKYLKKMTVIMGGIVVVRYLLIIILAMIDQFPEHVMLSLEITSLIFDILLGLVLVSCFSHQFVKIFKENLLDDYLLYYQHRRQLIPNRFHDTKQVDARDSTKTIDLQQQSFTG